MMHEYIHIKGARENNLKNIDVKIPRNKFVVITGISGSGKSSLAFDTIYAEGQRRYVESLSSYARQFLGQMEKPDVDYIEGLSPAISIDQKTTSRNPRSTVGTVTEIYDYLRLLWARIGIPHCPKCGKQIMQQTIDQIVEQILNIESGTKIQVLSPVIKGQKGEHIKVFESARRSGYVRACVDGEIVDLSENISLEKNKRHNIDIVVDRIVINENIRSRVTESVETATSLSGGIVVIDIIGGDRILFSQNYACDGCGISIEELAPRMFSFNNPFGACNKCGGLGVETKIDEDRIIPNRDISILEGGICASGWSNADDGTIAKMYYDSIALKMGFKLSTPIRDLPDGALDIILYGTKGDKLKLHSSRGTYFQTFEGIVRNLERRYRETSSEHMRMEIEESMSEISCTECKGNRLSKMALSVRIAGINISEFCRLSITDTVKFVENLALSEKDMFIADRILREIVERLKFLTSVGLDYLTLSRSAGTLSGGESQRIRLATQIGSSLMGVLYILDEPSIGLHQRDNDKLLDTLNKLRDIGNTLIVVEHDEDTMNRADYIIDIGPGAGVNGGNVIFEGLPCDIYNCPDSMTGMYLSGKKKIEVPKSRRPGNGHELEIIGASVNNLKRVNVKFPLGCFISITGVSGSGKSSLINEILYKQLAVSLNRAKLRAGEHKEIRGIEHLDKVIDIDQSAIGRTPRSNPATYTGLFGDIREIYTSTNDAKMRGYTPGRFSFNVKGGRCEACMGDGLIKIEMHFLPDIYVQCDVCKGKRYNKETLEVKYKGKNIFEVLDMTVEEALGFFENIPKIYKKLNALNDVGLSYIKLGQPSTTLSGGEAQRVKLASELAKRSTGKTIYILDEPTTGLHIADVDKLVCILHKLVDMGNTIVVIEHNLDVIKTSDYIIDIGPEGGDKGGKIVCSGTPEDIIKNKISYTAKYLKKFL